MQQKEENVPYKMKKGKQNTHTYLYNAKSYLTNHHGAGMNHGECEI